MIRDDEHVAFRKSHSPAEALAKIYKYCAYQERSHKEVKNKLYEYGLHSSDVEEILSRLITDGFLNEERFAKAYAGGKFRIKKWGRIKIENDLESLGLTKRCIATGLKEISDDDYRNTLVALLEKKAQQVEEDNIFKKRDTLARYVIGKGYEPELVWGLLKELFPK